MTHDTASHVVVNGRFLARRVTGVERYGREILRCIGGHFRVESTHRQGWKGHGWEQFVLPTKLSSHAILWSPANTGPLIVRQQILTLHDLSPLERPEWFRTSFAVWYRLFLPILVRRAHKVFTPSEHVRQKTIKRFGVKHVVVTPNGVDSSIFHPGAKQAEFDLPRSYILFVGSLEPRKNLDLLLSAWNEIKHDFKETWLIIAGVSGGVFKAVNLSHELERVRFLGYVKDETLAGLYANAIVLVLPSQEEGFGLPALEAMASGTPVIVSDGGALPELVCDAGLIFNLGCHSSEEISVRSERSEEALSATEELRHSPSAHLHVRKRLINTLKECLSDAHLRSALKEKGLARAKQFSWQTTADLVWEKLNEL